MARAVPYHVMDGYSFVAYPNRNSVPFREFYDIPEAETVVRGSLRYEGNPMFVQALADLSWLDPAERDWLRDGMTWAEIQQRTISAEDSTEKYAVSWKIRWWKADLPLAHSLLASKKSANSQMRQRATASFLVSAGWVFSPLKGPQSEEITS